MGGGKSSVGRALGERLGRRFIDLDDVIVAHAGRSVAEIFAQEGEAAFRQREAAALDEVLSDGAPILLALGGGAYVQPGVPERLRSAGFTTIHLDAPVTELAARCRATGPERPLARDLNQFEQLHAARRERYMQADVQIQTSSRSVAEVVDAIVRALALEDAASTPPEVQ
jgi:shikimate kinase